jgi:uncharacterized protein YlzI (FlbEa/FlbD family)
MFKLTDEHWINPDHIIRIHNRKSLCAVWMTNAEEYLIVYETIDELMRRLRLYRAGS